jgi:hypothetical protein
MDAGDSDAKQKGMSKAIYDGIFAAMDPKLPATMDKTPVEASWAQLAYAVANGVVKSLSAAPSGNPSAQVVSTSADDAAFWAWFAGFAGVFNSWASSAAPTVLTLQSALKTFFQTNPVPTSLNGSLK